MTKAMQALVIDLEEVMKKHFPDEPDRIALGVSFSLPADYQKVYFVSNASRRICLHLFEAAADKVRAQLQ